MATPELYYIGALKSALQGDISGALNLQLKGDEVKEHLGLDFSEVVSDDFPFVEEAVNTLLSSYDFTRCVRPNGTVYGTRGKCRKGTETDKPSPERASRLERELPRTGMQAQVPGRKAEESDEKLKAVKERVKKELEAEKARQKRLDDLEESTTNMATELFSSRGGVSDGSLRSKNGLNNIKENLKKAYKAGAWLRSKTNKLIDNGDLKGLLRYAQEVTSKSKEEYAKERMKEVRERQKAELKESLAKAKERGASQEEISKSKLDADYYNKRDLQRVKVQATGEYYALTRLLMG